MRYFDKLRGITHLRQKARKNIIYIIYFAFCVCFSWASSFAQTESGDFFLKDSINRVLSLKTIECGIRMDVNIDGIEYSARGRYEEQALPKPPAGNFLRSMYRLNIDFLMNAPMATGSEPNRMTVVCHLSDDRAKSQIWQYTSIEGEKIFNIIRVAPVEDAIKRSKKQPNFTQVSEVRNLGGLAGQLRQIDQFYEFISPPQAAKLEDEGEQVDVWKITGSLRGEHFNNLLKQLGGIDKKKRYPSDLPTDIELWIGQHDSFPYKIRYLNRRTEKSDKLTQLFQSSYYHVILNGDPIPATRFAPFDQGEYSEGVFNFQDITDSFIRSLGL